MTKNRTIVCVGDSTTSMEWCHPNWFDWIDFSLRQSDEENGWKTKMINSGKDGGTVPFFLKNFDFLVGRFNPDLVILSLGANHLELDGNVEGMTEELINKVKGIGAKVVLWSFYKTINEELNPKFSQIRDFYKELSNRLDIQFVDIFEVFSRYDLSKIFTYKYLWENKEWGLRPGDVDFLHCNLIGNQIIAQEVASKIFGLNLLDFEEFGTMKLVDLSKFLIQDSSKI